MAGERPVSARKLSRVVPYRLARSNAEMVRLVSLVCEMNGFKLNVWRVVSAIGTYQPISGMEICQHTTIDKAMVSRAIRELVERGLIDRRADKRDARWAQIELTPEGTAVYTKMASEIDALETHLFADLPPGKLDEFMEMLGLVEQRVRRTREMIELNRKTDLIKLLKSDIS